MTDHAREANANAPNAPNGAKVSKVEALNLLRGFQDKAAGSHGGAATQRATLKAWTTLTETNVLTVAERNALLVAWTHHRLGEGRAELDRVCETVRTRLTDG